jgi:hypothetical protein
MRGVIPPLTSTPSWRGVQLKHRDFKQIGSEGVIRIQLTHHRDQWRPVVDMVMNFVLHKGREIYWPAEQLLVSQVGGE